MGRNRRSGEKALEYNAILVELGHLYIDMNVNPELWFLLK